MSLWEVIKKHFGPLVQYWERTPASWRFYGAAGAMGSVWWPLLAHGPAWWSYPMIAGVFLVFLTADILCCIPGYRRGLSDQQQIYTRDDIEGRWWH